MAGSSEGPSNAKEGAGEAARKGANCQSGPTCSMRKPQFKRMLTSVLLLGVLCGLVHLGHVCVSIALVVLQTICFAELVSVGYRERKAPGPMFRTLQWGWFAIAMAAAYSTDVMKAPMFAGKRFRETVSRIFGHQAGQATMRLTQFFAQYEMQLAFAGYMCLFCLTAMALSRSAGEQETREGTREQIRQLSFTFLALSLTVLQVKMAIFSVFQGLVWFLLPTLLVVINDSAALVFGVLLGRRVFRGRLLSISPNKTWEGFLGAALTTLFAGCSLPPFMTGNWLTCPFNDLYLNQCKPWNTQEAISLPLSLGSIKPMQLHGLALGFLASLVAPFGGFFASAIKRAYDVKDFANSLPGHGGFMDRFDCQLVMYMATYVYLTVVIPPEPSSLLIHSFSTLPQAEQARVLSQLLLIYQPS